MELENVNPNDDNVVTNNLSNVNFYFWKTMEVEFKSEHYVLFFKQGVVISPKLNSKELSSFWR
jgi:hypothetical protein